MKRIVTVGEARQLTGPGTSIWWRPASSSYNPKNPDGDPAAIMHVSDADDLHYAQSALARERIGN